MKKSEKFKSVVAAALYKEEAGRFATYVRAGARHDFRRVVSGSSAAFEEGGLVVIRPVEREGRRLGTIYLHVDLRRLTRRLIVFSWIVMGVLGVSLLVTILLTSLLQRPITAPILELAETARRISERKDFSVRASPGSGGEIGTLTDAFNEMLNILQERRSELLAVNEQLRGEIKEREAAEARVLAHAARLTQLNAITRGIAERQDVESILQTVTASLEEQLPADLAIVCRYETERQTLLVSSIGPRGTAVVPDEQFAVGATIPIDQNGLSRCLRGALVCEPDTAAVAVPFARRLRGAGLRAVVLAPLLVESSVFGVLIVARKTADSFTSGECEFLKQLSEHVALATHQTQLYTALQRAYDDLRQTQQAVMQQERLRALGQMASGIAHDINK